MFVIVTLTTYQDPICEHVKCVHCAACTVQCRYFHSIGKHPPRGHQDTQYAHHMVIPAANMWDLQHGIHDLEFCFHLVDDTYIPVRAIFSTDSTPFRCHSRPTISTKETGIEDGQDSRTRSSSTDTAGQTVCPACQP